MEAGNGRSSNRFMYMYRFLFDSSWFCFWLSSQRIRATYLRLGSSRRGMELGFPPPMHDFLCYFFICIIELFLLKTSRVGSTKQASYSTVVDGGGLPVWSIIVLVLRFLQLAVCHEGSASVVCQTWAANSRVCVCVQFVFVLSGVCSYA